MYSFCNGRYTTERDKYQWILTEYYEGKDKKGNLKTHSRETYHATLDQVLTHIINRECGYCENMEELLKLLNNIPTVINMIKDKAA